MAERRDAHITFLAQELEPATLGALEMERIKRNALEIAEGDIKVARTLLAEAAEDVQSFRNYVRGELSRSRSIDVSKAVETYEGIVSFDRITPHPDTLVIEVQNAVTDPERYAESDILAVQRSNLADKLALIGTVGMTGVEVHASVIPQEIVEEHGFDIVVAPTTQAAVVLKWCMPGSEPTA